MKYHIPYSDYAKNALSFVTFVTLGWIRNGGGSSELTKRRIKGDETAYRPREEEMLWEDWQSMTMTAFARKLGIPKGKTCNP